MHILECRQTCKSTRPEFFFFGAGTLRIKHWLQGHLSVIQPVELWQSFGVRILSVWYKTRQKAFRVREVKSGCSSPNPTTPGFSGPKGTGFNSAPTDVSALETMTNILRQLLLHRSTQAAQTLIGGVSGGGSGMGSAKSDLKTRGGLSGGFNL